MGCLIVFRSVTEAQRAQRVLLRAGVTSVMTKPPLHLSGGSCAYALRVSYEQTPPALASLRRAGIRLQGVYIREDGLWREAVL